jgi:hypothetical protein
MLTGMALHPCPTCGRHVRVDVDRCAFCDAPVAAGAAAPTFVRVARMAAIGAAAVTLGACAETPKNTVEIHSDPTATASASAAPSATVAPHASAAHSAPKNPDDDEFNSPGGPGWHRRGGQCTPQGQCPPYGGAPPFDDFV